MSITVDEKIIGERTKLSTVPYSFSAETLEDGAIVGKNGISVEKNKKGIYEIGKLGAGSGGEIKNVWRERE